MILAAKASTVFVGSIFASLRPGSKSSLKKCVSMANRGNTVSNLTGLRFER